MAFGIIMWRASRLLRIVNIVKEPVQQLTICRRLCQMESLSASNVIEETYSPLLWLLENVLMNDSGGSGGNGGTGRAVSMSNANDIMLCRCKVYKCRYVHTCTTSFCIRRIIASTKRNKWFLIILRILDTIHL